MNKWLERALISAGAAVVSTTAIVTTSERPGKRKKRTKRGDKSSRDKESRGKDGALVDDEVPRSVGAQAAHDYRVGHDGGITTLDFIANVRDAGRNAAQRVGTVGGYLLGRQKPPPVEDDDGEVELDENGELRAAPKKSKAQKQAQKPARKKVRRRVRRKVGEAPREATSAKTGSKKKRKRARPGEEPVDELKELRDEAVKRATSAAAKHAADKAGLGEAARHIKESGEELWKKTEKLGRAVKDRVPEDLGERVGDSIGEAGKGIARGARALSERLRAALSEEESRERRMSDEDERAPSRPLRDEESSSAYDERSAPFAESQQPHASDVDVPADTASADTDAAEEPSAPLADRFGRGIKGFARWVEGPGAPVDDDDEGVRAPRRTRPRTTTADDVVEAKDADGAPADVVTPKDPQGPPAPVVEAKDASDDDAP